MSFLSVVESYWLHYTHDRDVYTLCIFGTWILNLSIWITCNLPYLLIDQFRLFRQYKIQPENEVDRREMWIQFIRSTLLQSLNAIPLWYARPLFVWSGFQARQLPTATTLLLQFLWFNVAEDFMFYWVHRLLHASKWAYRHIHSIHHRYKDPYSVAGAVAHPVELIFNFLLPTVLPPFLAGPLIWGRDGEGGCHVLLFWFWLWYRELRATEAHCGYILPWHLSQLGMKYLGYGGSAAHHIHHSQIKYNFGSFTWWDHLMGTTFPGREDGTTSPPPPPVDDKDL